MIERGAEAFGAVNVGEKVMRQLDCKMSFLVAAAVLVSASASAADTFRQAKGGRLENHCPDLKTKNHIENYNLRIEFMDPTNDKVLHRFVMDHLDKAEKNRTLDIRKYRVRTYTDKKTDKEHKKENWYSTTESFDVDKDGWVFPVKCKKAT